MKWWYRCDLALIYSYLKNELNNEEKAIVKNYIKSISLRDKFKILWYYIESKLKNIKRRLKL